MGAAQSLHDRLDPQQRARGIPEAGGAPRPERRSRAHARRRCRDCLARRVVLRCLPKRAFWRVRDAVRTGDVICFASTRRNLDVFHAGIAGLVGRRAAAPARQQVPGPRRRAGSRRLPEEQRHGGRDRGSAGRAPGRDAAVVAQPAGSHLGCVRRESGRDIRLLERPTWSARHELLTGAAVRERIAEAKAPPSLRVRPARRSGRSALREDGAGPRGGAGGDRVRGRRRRSRGSTTRPAASATTSISGP